MPTISSQWMRSSARNIKLIRRSLWQMPKSKPNYYAVVKGRRPGIYTRWEGEGQAKEQASGYAGALQKGFPSKTEALAWYRTNGGVISSEQLEQLNDTNELSSLPPISFSPEDQSTFISEDAKIREQYEIPPSAQIIYTDGACPSNGLFAGRAGIGIFFSPDSPHNISARLPGPHQTNQRAELYAVLKALEHLHTNPPTPADVFILTDSSYVVKGLTEWVIRWEREGWKTANRGDVVSRDLFKRAKDMRDLLGDRGTTVELTHVPGHAGVWGNEMADKLAVRGAWLEDVEDTECEEFDDPVLDKLIAEMVDV